MGNNGFVSKIRESQVPNRDEGRVPKCPQTLPNWCMHPFAMLP